MSDALILDREDAYSIRLEARCGALATHTSGRGDGFIQGNVAIVPGAQAAAFEAFCRANPQPCPLLAVGRPGDPTLPTLGRDIDIRTDLPRYRVYRDGAMAAEPTTIAALWRDDLVTFVLGCSFTFERALIRAGIPLRHVQQGRNVAMYRTTIETTAAGPFGGPMVVSMRPVCAADAARAADITARFPEQHGRPRPYRRARGDRRHGPGPARLRRPRHHHGGRDPRLLGLRRY